jgi:adenylate cyclase
MDVADLGLWLAGAAKQREDLGALFEAFCFELRRRGSIINRGSLGLEGLDPEVGGSRYVWEEDAVRHTSVPRAGVVQSPGYQNSPMRIVDETGEPFRQRLTGAQTMPLLEELRLSGATDYAMFPMPFVDRTRSAVISYSTQSLAGFSDAELHALGLATDLFGPYAERQVLRQIAVDLLDVYVGPHTGRRIIEGHVERGDVETIEAAIWLADLRGFTRRSETAAIKEVLKGLNAWLEAMVTSIHEHDGEVLKFIGDAVLAIFPTGPERSGRGACEAALAAAEGACRQTDDVNRRRAEKGLWPLEFGLGLHFGEVVYGNIGAPRRLDFTVIGAAVNRASRLQELSKQLRRRVIISGTFAGYTKGPLVPLGIHRLRDVSEPQSVYGLPADAGANPI